MKYFAIPLLFLILMLIGIASSTFGIEFGNVLVFADKIVTQDRDKLTVQLENGSDRYSFDSNDIIIIWNIHPGVHRLKLLDNQGNLLQSISVNVFPNLTSKVNLSVENKRYILSDCGFADQAGHIFTFGTDKFKDFPGDIGDRLNILKPAGIKTGFKYLTSETAFRDGSWGVFSISSLSDYSFDGLIYSSSLPQNNLTPLMIPMSNMVFINTSDPFAGYSNSNISLIKNTDEPAGLCFESAIGDYGRRFHRGMANIKSPNNIITIFGSYCVEDMDDAYPRSNVNDILPHNGMDNSEFVAGAEIAWMPEVKFDIRALCKRYKRDIYDHQYLFNLQHAPREEGYRYRGIFSIYGRLPHKISFSTGIELGRDEYQKGDGLYFDNLASYQRDDWILGGNPDVDATGLFWSWDNIDSLTPNIYEAHVFEEYIRERTHQWKINLELRREITNNTQISLSMNHSNSSFRRYRSYLPSFNDADYVENIGFDLAGENINDNNSFTDIPRPKQFNVSLSARYLDRQYFVACAVDLIRFDPGTMMLADLLNPMISGDPDILDMADLRHAGIKSKIGYRFASTFLTSPTTTVFFNYFQQYHVPSYTYLYFGYDYLENKVSEGGYYSVLGNPSLELEKKNGYEIGVIYQNKDNHVTFSYRNEKYENLVNPIRLSGVYPKMYSIYVHANPLYDINNNFISVTYQRKGNRFFTCVLTAGIKDFDFNEKTIAGLGKFQPDNLIKQPNTYFKNIISRFSFDFSFQYYPGVKYTPMREDYDPITLYSDKGTPDGPINSGNARDFFELNVGITASIIKFGGGHLAIRADIINVLNRINHLKVYETSGLPDVTNWLVTEEGQTWIEANSSTADSSSLTGEKKYTLASDDPNNFGRPRIFRIIARLEF